MKRDKADMRGRFSAMGRAACCLSWAFVLLCSSGHAAGQFTKAEQCDLEMLCAEIDATIQAAISGGNSITDNAIRDIIDPILTDAEDQGIACAVLDEVRDPEARLFLDQYGDQSRKGANNWQAVVDEFDVPCLPATSPDKPGAGDPMVLPPDPMKEPTPELTGSETTRINCLEFDANGDCVCYQIVGELPAQLRDAFDAGDPCVERVMDPQADPDLPDLYLYCRAGCSLCFSSCVTDPCASAADCPFLLVEVWASASVEDLQDADGSGAGAGDGLGGGAGNP